MSKKKYLLSALAIICLLIASTIYVMNKYPSEEEKAYHRIAMCYVIEHREIQADNPELIAFFNKVAQGGVPDYALNKPKIYDDFARELINYYLKLSPQQQQEVKSDRQSCDRILKGA
ncbi:hypothetical protein I2F27_00715 [Acinetobacter sp. B5B]|uniref:hypothetical protein n=1 Tax=Acinetobacter baretiae TaxID=2605383 RepID=UPI0018C275B3|nr:hypothetical protein [Acinetobacter baretiae]MBF7681859.1 hypothetical protein [Acinetobacter baretiae]MBF7686208.1 hypothetical protein [Acinetobacter baretiae]